jgi:hypothetical protein
MFSEKEIPVHHGVVVPPGRHGIFHPDRIEKRKLRADLSMLLGSIFLAEVRWGQVVRKNRNFKSLGLLPKPPLSSLGWDINWMPPKSNLTLTILN